MGALFFMGLVSIQMESIPPGAPIIAMGMLVENAIVVAAGRQQAMARGKSSARLRTNPGGRAQGPLQGAPVIGIMAFAGVGLSPDGTGEFRFSRFAEIGISPLVSWVLAITVTPLLADYLFRQPGDDGTDPCGGAVFRAGGTFLRGALRARGLVPVLLIGVTAVCYAGFDRVAQQFLPRSDRPLFLVHCKLARGADVLAISHDLTTVEDWLLARDDAAVTLRVANEGIRAGPLPPHVHGPRAGSRNSRGMKAVGPTVRGQPVSRILILPAGRVPRSENPSPVACDTPVAVRVCVMTGSHPPIAAAVPNDRFLPLRQRGPAVGAIRSAGTASAPRANVASGPCFASGAAWTKRARGR